MRRLMLGSATAFIALTAGAAAHPGSPILTTGSKTDRAAMTEDVSFSEENGVHVFRGAARKPVRINTLLGGDPVAAPRVAERAVRIQIVKRPWRSIRRLRTQGFYSGVPYPSRRYTQGFYSGN